MKNLVLKAYVCVPLYEQHVWLYAARDPVKTYYRIAKKFKHKPDDGPFQAISITDDVNQHAMLFYAGSVSENDIAHEIKHIADFIMDATGRKTCEKCRDEPTAYLVGYLAVWAKKKLKRAGVKVQ